MKYTSSKSVLSFLLAICFIVGLWSCTEQQKPNSQSSKVEAKAEKQAEEKRIDVSYSAWPIKGVDTAVESFKKKFGTEDQYKILAINRIDIANIKRADTLIIPDKILGNFIDYSPFPLSLSKLNDVDKIVFFSYATQSFAAYEKGKLVYSGPTSMGTKIHPTPTGLYFANWKAEETISTVDDEWKLKWNFNVENKEGIGWHQYAMPGYPASHSCLRMLETDAKWMYEWADQWIVEGENNVLAQGTPTVVFGAYPFGARRPWLHLLDNPKANEISKEDLAKELEPLLPRIMEQQNKRKAVKDAQVDSTK